MDKPDPKWRRRSAARPGEIAAAALAVFGECGFAAARLEAIAARAGVSKGALYLYFPTKEELFRGAVGEAVRPLLSALDGAAQVDGPFAEVMPRLLARAAEALGRGPTAAVARSVIAESRNFPDLARIWHDAVAGRALAGVAAMTARAQARGEVRAGDPRLIAFSLMGPLVMGALFREVFAEAGADAPDLQALAEAHARLMLRALSPSPLPLAED